MSIEGPGAVALDYLPCRYGNSRLKFRGPKREVQRPYVAFLGSSETYGRFVPQPFPSLVEQRSGRECLNLGCLHAGLDSFVNDPDVLSLASSAQIAVLQVPGAHNLSNRFFRVHARRNDRFLTASPLLQAIYREVDFTEFNFTRHMLGHLYAVSPERFETVRDELRQAWTGRMRLMLRTIRCAVVLLWLRGDSADCALVQEPPLVTADMVDGLREDAAGVVEIALGDLASAGNLDGMVFGQMEALAARRLPGPEVHARIADGVMRCLTKEL